MRGPRRSPYRFLTMLLMWLLPLCAIVNSGLELLAIPGNAPKFSKRWDHNGENNSISAEREVHHIPPGQQSRVHQQMMNVIAMAPPEHRDQKTPPAATDSRKIPVYDAATPQNGWTEIPVPPPEKVC